MCNALDAVPLLCPLRGDIDGGDMEIRASIIAGSGDFLRRHGNAVYAPGYRRSRKSEHFTRDRRNLQRKDFGNEVEG